uniref:Uncharacterized protein n=1 Tax=Anguilla anguilla TaxID=7936 RepID=A0A0E9X0I9_ANGAN
MQLYIQREKNRQQNPHCPIERAFFCILPLCSTVFNSKIIVRLPKKTVKCNRVSF